MHPAWSIIFFTSVSGMGFGLAGWIVLGFLNLDNDFQFIFSFIFTFGLIISGLLSSTLHLGHPERAWRALSQWQTSWLSREGILSGSVLVILASWFFCNYFFDSTPNWLSTILLLLILATVYATAMIYASLKTVLSWYNPLTPICYLNFAACSGLIANIFLISIFEQKLTISVINITILIFTLTWIFKIMWWLNLDTSFSKSSIETATGLGNLGRVNSLLPPHTSENYLQKEMGFQIARKHAIKLRILSITFGGIIPLTIIFFLSNSTIFIGLALITHFFGILIERWLFFAEAKHVVSLYYGK